MTEVTNESLLADITGTCNVLPDFLNLRSKQFPDKTAYRQYNRATKKWTKYSFALIAEKVLHWRRALAALGLKHGDRIGILLNNSVDAVLIDQAALANGLITVPMPAIDTPKSSAYILADSEAACFVTNKKDRWDSISRAKIALPNLKTVVFTDESLEDTTSTPVLLGLEQWLKSADSTIELTDDVKSDDLASIVYTSGTTGNPKGVMLTHSNIIANIINGLNTIKPLPRPDYTFLSFLPLSHTFERTDGYYLPLAMGLTVTFNRSIALLNEDLRLVKPHMLISVPRIYERIYLKIQKALEEASPRTRKYFNLCVNVGWRNYCRDNGLPVPEGSSRLLDYLLDPLLKKFVASKILSVFGGNLEIAVAGGAALSEPVAKMFLGLGLYIVQGYGMTECAPVISVNRFGANDPKTVGNPIENTEVRLDPKTQEIQVRSPSVMKGYWHRPEETAKVIRDGWLCTGDVGEIDERGLIRIRGRIKDIIVTSTGEKVPPVDLESAIESDSLFSQVCVIGENRPYITFLAVLDPAHWEEVAKHFNVDPADPDAYKTTVVRAALVRRAKAAAAGFPHYALPRNIVVCPEPWTIENGLITPTLKIKRKPIYERFRDEIEAMYAIHG